ncbi:MAG: DUF3782 domain-containing protein [Pseudomonadota bacterium]
MNEPEIKEIIIRELPAILENDPDVREAVRRLMEGRFADKYQTESRFDRILDELRSDREAETERWRENVQRWEKNDKLWEESRQRWEKNDKILEENQKAIRQLMEELKKLDRKHDSTIGALGARWGLNSERSFRNALKGILEEHFGVKVENITDFDDDGEVFGRPDQIELDIVIKNGLLIICEIKSSFSKSDMHIFEKKARFYQKRHNKTATQIMIISPMVDQRAKALAEKLGITVYGYAEDVDPTVFEKESTG